MWIGMSKLLQLDSRVILVHCVSRKVGMRIHVKNEQGDQGLTIKFITISWKWKHSRYTSGMKWDFWLADIAPSPIFSLGIPVSVGPWTLTPRITYFLFHYQPTHHGKRSPGTYPIIRFPNGLGCLTLIPITDRYRQSQPPWFIRHRPTNLGRLALLGLDISLTSVIIFKQRGRNRLKMLRSRAFKSTKPLTMLSRVQQFGDLLCRWLCKLVSSSSRKSMASN